MRNQSKRGPLLEDRGEMETRVSSYIPQIFVVIALTCYTNGRLAKVFPWGASCSTGSNPATSRSEKDGGRTFAHLVFQFRPSLHLW
jgi:hypothetical protein